ncbi:amidohydrolase family protein [Pigmentiphaga soli]|uniref:Amidohydrolase family protein n=1 Tax=Pigmentiphaga soli TaxID=1007095 RepID=A0ABP8HF28_9BURK
MTPDIAPADPHPRPPRFDVPSPAWDCHAHVFGPVGRFPYAARREYTPPDQPLAAYLRMLDAIGVRHGVLSQPSVYGDDNRCLLDALRAAGGRLRGIVVADVLAMDDARLEALTADGVRGVRINMALPGGLPVALLDDVGARLRGSGWHLEIVLDKVGSLPALIPALRRAAVPVVIEQMGSVRVAAGPAPAGFAELAGLLRDGAVWAKISHPYKISAAPPAYRDTVPLARELVAAAPTRLLWGSDWPHPRVPGPMPNDGALLDLLYDWIDGDRAIAETILCRNPAQLYGPHAGGGRTDEEGTT